MSNNHAKILLNNYGDFHTFIYELFIICKHIVLEN